MVANLQDIYSQAYNRPKSSLPVQTRSSRAAGRKPTLPYLDAPTTGEMVSSLGQNSLSTLETIGAALDTPGAFVRGVAVGKPLSVFGEEISGQKRVSGQELLETYGLLDEDANPYMSAAAGFGAEVLTDPFAFIAGPTSAFTKGGKAIRGAGLLDDVGDAAFAALGKTKKLRNQALSGRKAYEKLVSKGVPITPQNIKNFRVIGPREARTSTRVRDVVNLPSLKLQSNATPEALRAASAESATRLAKVEDYLRPRGLTFADVADQKITGGFGLGYFDPTAVAETPRLMPLFKRMDAIGQAARWNPASRAVSSLFDQRVGGEVSIPEQLAAMRKFDANLAARGVDTGRAAMHAEKVRRATLNPKAKELLGADDLLGPEGRNFLIRMKEEVPNPTDLEIAKNIDNFPDVQQAWKEIQSYQDSASQALGMRPLTKATGRNFDYEFFPRFPDEAKFGDRGRAGKSFLYGTKDNAYNPRQKQYETPGGTVDQIEASELPEVQALVRGDKDASVRKAGEAVARYINEKHAVGSPTRTVRPFEPIGRVIGPDGKPVQVPAIGPKGTPLFLKDKKTGKFALDASGNKIPKMVDELSGEILDTGQGIRLVDFFKRLDPAIAKKQPFDKSRIGLQGVGVYQTHPLQAMARSMVSQGQSRSNAKLIYNELAQDAAQTLNSFDTQGSGFLDVRGMGKGFKRLDRALNDIASQTSLMTQKAKATSAVRERLKDAVRSELNIPAGKDIDLKQFAVSEAVIDRLRKTKDFFNSPAAQDQIIGYLDQYTGLFKSLLLAFPARHTRDMYSNAISVYYEVGSPLTAHWGFSAAKRVLSGNFAEADEYLRQIPRYKNLYNQALKSGNDASQVIRDAFVSDVAESGVLRGLATSDLVTTIPGEGKLNQLLPGISKTDYGTVGKELTKGYDEFFTVRNVGLDPDKLPRVTKNPFLNASEKLSDYSDSVARLGGMLAMMKQGNSAGYAAQRMSAALVDYSSLTTFERSVIKRWVFPWWSYNSRIGKYAVESILTKPGGGYAQMVRAMSSLQRPTDDTYIPDALRQSFAFRLPTEEDDDNPLVKNALNNMGFGLQGNTTFLRDFDVPGVDMLSLLAMKPTIFGSMQDTASNIALQTQPFVQTAVSLASGQDLFSKRPIRQARSSLDKIYSGLMGKESKVDPALKMFANLIPTPRVAGVAGNLLDPRLPLAQRIPKTVINALTGVKLQDVSPEYELSEARRKAAEKLEAFMTDYTESYIPKDRLPQVPEELMPYYQLYRTLGKDLRDRRKAKQ